MGASEGKGDIEANGGGGEGSQLIVYRVHWGAIRDII
jgi:hypothetical protein